MTDGKCLPGEWPDDMRDDDSCPRWKPAIHMPRWACRTVVELVEVRVERVQPISEADAKAEGAEGYPVYGSYRMGFRALWDSKAIHGPGAWERNDWVWRLVFSKVEVRP